MAAQGFGCSMKDLVPRPGIKPRPPRPCVLGAQSLSHRTTRGVPHIAFFEESGSGNTWTEWFWLRLSREVVTKTLARAAGLWGVNWAGGPASTMAHPYPSLHGYLSVLTTQQPVSPKTSNPRERPKHKPQFPLWPKLGSHILSHLLVMVYVSSIDYVDQFWYNNYTREQILGGKDH